MDPQPYGCSRRLGLGCLVIFGSIFLCIGSITLATDIGCYNSMVRKIPIYPGAQIVTMSYNLFRAFGMGETLALITTTDPPDVVRNWYGSTVGAAYKDVQTNGGDPFFFMANARYTITDATSGSGTQILLSGACAGGAGF